MTRQDTAFIGIVADSSGSMSDLIEETVGSINRLVKEQQDVPGEAFFSLSVFDYKSKWIKDFVNIKDVTSITKDDYWMGGMTALYDATADMIIRTGKQLSFMKEEDRPSKVVIVVITDGVENQSREYNLERLQTLIKQQTEKYNWQFMFLGADINAQKTAQSIGIAAGSAMSYNATRKGMGAVYEATSNSLRSYRVSKLDSLVISDEDRNLNALDKA